MKKINVSTIARMGIILALIVVVEIFEASFLNMPQGGSVSLASLVFLLSMLFFTFTELTILFVLWRLLMIIFMPPFIVTPLQFFLDYIVSYSGFLAVYPFVKKEKITPIFIAVLIANIWRYFVHVFTGMVYFAEYADQAPLLQYSLVYNLTYMGPTLLVQLVLATIFVPLLKKMEKAIIKK